MKFAIMSPASFAREPGCMASFNERQYILEKEEGICGRDS